MEIGEMGYNFSESLVLPPPPAISLNPKMRITFLKNCLSTFKFFPVTFFPLFCISTENRTKLKKT